MRARTNRSEIGKTMKRMIRDFYVPQKKKRIALELYKKKRIFLYLNLIIITLVYESLGSLLCTQFLVSEGKIGDISFGIYAILCFYFLYLLIDISISRLHDIGRSGWWVVTPVFFLIRLWLGLEMEGEPGTNKWGINGQEEELGKGQLSTRPSKKVISVYRAAAYAENDRAQYILGCLYLRGRGVVQDNLLALLWLLSSVRK